MLTDGYWRAGLNLLNISVDTLRPDRFESMTRRRGHERVMAAIHHAVSLGYDPVKVPSLTFLLFHIQLFWQILHLQLVSVRHVISNECWVEAYIGS